MRRMLFWGAWGLLLALPILYVGEIIWKQDLPPVQPWQWLLMGVVVVMIYFTRDRDDVLKHHVV